MIQLYQYMQGKYGHKKEMPKKRMGFRLMICRKRRGTLLNGLANSFKDDPLGKYMHCLSARLQSLVGVFEYLCVYYVYRGGHSSWARLKAWDVKWARKYMRDIKKRWWGEQDGMVRGRERKEEGRMVAFLLSWAAVCFISTPASFPPPPPPPCSLPSPRRRALLLS